MTDSPQFRGSGQRATRCVVFGDFIHLQGLGEDVAISAERPRYRVEDLPLAPVRLSYAQAQTQPGRLLLPSHAVVPFTGREVELSDLSAWLARSEQVAVRLIHGQEGRGKTRLASRLAAEASAVGWFMWRAHHGPASASVRMAMPTNASGLLVSVDYADRWPISNLIELVGHLSALAKRAGVVVRVLLLARSAGFWWSAVDGRVDGELGVESDAHELGPLSTEVDRAALFTAARDAYAAAMGLGLVSEIRLSHQLDDDGSADVLTIHMAALAAVDACLHDAVPPADPASISAYLLRRERAHWHLTHARTEHRLATSPQTLGRAAYVATLIGPLSRSHAVTALMQTGAVSTAEQADQVIDDHLACFPSQESGTVLEPLHPGRLGEDFIALTTPGHSHDDTMCDDWAAGAPVRLLAETGVPSPWSAPAVRVLIETARRWPHVADGQLYPLLRGNPELAIAAGGAALVHLAEPPLADMDMLEAVVPLLPVDPHADLGFAMTAITTQLTRGGLARTADPAHRAYLCATLTLRFLGVGQFSSAADIGMIAFMFYQQLAAVNPGKYEPDQAGLAVNYGVALAETGRLTEALDVFELARRIAQRRLEIDPGRYAPILAMALTSIAATQTRRGQHQEARDVAAEAVDINRRFPGKQDDMAHALMVYGTALSNTRQKPEAIAFFEEAVAKWRLMAAADPALYEAKLAGALSGLVAGLANSGRGEDAVLAAEEALEIWRRVVAANPAAHQHYYASTLFHYTTALFNVRRKEDALAAINQAIGIQERLALANPRAFGSELFDYLYLRGLIRSKIGHAPDGFDVALYRRLTVADAEAFEPYLAMSLHNQSIDLHDSGDFRAAAAAAEESVTICQRVLETRSVPPEFSMSPEVLLAEAWINLGSIWLGHQDALAITGEALPVIRRLVRDDAVGQTYLLEALCKFAWARAQTRAELDQALSAAREAVAIAEELADQLPDQASEISARANIALADVLESMGREDEANEIWDKI